MKKLLLFTVILANITTLFAQNRLQIPENIRRITFKKPVYYQVEPQQNQNAEQGINSGNKSLNYEEIGQTVYDLQTNASVDHRYYLYPDGTIGGVFSLGLISPTFSDHKTAYTYFDGAAWINSAVETVPTWGPTYSHLGSNGEVVIAYTGSQLIMNKRTTKGTGVWSESLIPTPVGTVPNWPRIAVSGNTIHVLAAHQSPTYGGPVYQGQSNSLLYYRSQDAGATWDIQAQILPGLDVASGFLNGFGADCYAWSEPKGDTIAFVVGNNWTDIILMKSFDGGSTWNKTVIFHHPYPNFDESVTAVGDGMNSVDTPYVCDSHLAVQLDTAGKAHVVFGIMRVANFLINDNITEYFPATDGLAYWKEGDPTYMNLNPDAVSLQGKLIAWVQDHDSSGVLFDNFTSEDNFAKYGAGSLTSQPQISIENNNDIYIVYTSPVESMVSATGQFYNHIWGRYFNSSLNCWTDIIEITNGPDFDGTECIFPALSKTNDIYIHIVLMMDGEPGLAISGDMDPYATNSIMHFTIDKVDFLSTENCNSVLGAVFNDVNQNGIMDLGEQGLSGQVISLDNGSAYTTTNNDGNYYFITELGNHSISYMPPQYWNLTSDSLTYNFYFNGSNHSTGLNFGIVPNVNVQDVGISLTGTNVRPGFETTYWIYYRNHGTQTMAGNIIFNFAPILSHLFSQPAEQSLSGNVLDFLYDTLASFENRTIMSHFQVPVNVQLIGDTIISTCDINPIVSDVNTINNYDTLIQVITGSYDPNDKTVSPKGILGAGYVLHGQKLTYTVRFQNTGNDTAFTVMIKDTLDSDFNPGTFNILASSHPVAFTLEGTGVVTFTFNNILLPDSNVNQSGSNGFVKYSIEPKPGLADFTEVRNKAYIYFDYNPPVITNEVLNTYVSTLTGIKEANTNITVSIFPNPTISELNIKTDKDLTGKKYTILDVFGRKLLEGKMDGKLTKVSVENLAKGIYMFQIKSDALVSVKFIKK